MENDMRGLVQKYVPLIFLRACTATELHVNVLKGKIEMGHKEIALMA
jgi:hypothetical protein